MSNTPKMEHDFASMQPGMQTDWLEFTHQFNPEDPSDVRRYRLDTSWLLSHHHCIYGQGCPSILITGATSYGGCCQIGAVMSSRDDKKKVAKFVKRLTSSDTERTPEELKDWCDTERDEDGRAISWHTKVVNGNCIFTNVGTADAPRGCSLHALALRLNNENGEDVTPLDTKPHVCWLLPNAALVENAEDTDDGIMVITVTSHKASWWTPAPDNHTSNMNGPGWLCTETGDAFNGAMPVYVEYEAELRKELGDRAYEAMAEILHNFVGLRTNYTAAEQLSGGRPLIPLFVQQRVEGWRADANLPRNKKNNKRRQNAIDALASTEASDDNDLIDLVDGTHPAIG